MDVGILKAEKTRIANINIGFRDNFKMGFHEDERPTMATIEAMKETINDIKDGNFNVFYDVEDFMTDLLAN